MEYLLNKIKNEKNLDLINNKNAISKLKIEIEKAKIKLSNEYFVDLFIDELIPGFNFRYILSRKKFEEINEEIFINIRKQLEKIYMENKEDIEEMTDTVILMGDSSQIPKIQQLIEDFFNNEILIIKNYHKEVAVFGRLVNLWYLRDDDEITYDYYVIPCIEINLDLGIETLYGIMSKVIAKGSLFCYHIFESIFVTTLYDNQTNITINIYEGEKIFAKENHFLAQIKINIPPMPR